MEALHQGASTALVLVGLAALLYGLGALWRAVSQARAEQQDLALERDLRERVAQHRREQAEDARRVREMLFALVPAATTALGHWLGSRSAQRTQHARDLPGPPGCAGCIPRPMPPFAPVEDDDDTHVELDLESLLDALSEPDLGHWLASTMRAAKARRAPADGDANATFVHAPVVTMPTGEPAS